MNELWLLFLIGLQFIFIAGLYVKIVNLRRRIPLNKMSRREAKIQQVLEELFDE